MRVYVGLIMLAAYICLSRYSQVEYKCSLIKEEAIRVICNAGYRDHTQPLFKKSKVLSLKYVKLRFMHSYTHHRLPFSFEQTWLSNRDHNQIRVLRNADNLRIPPHHFASLKRLPLFSFPQLWNAENDSKFIPSPNIYSKHLKTALLANIVV
jgi:hypothetical protein